MELKMKRAEDLQQPERPKPRIAQLAGLMLIVQIMRVNLDCVRTPLAHQRIVEQIA